MFKIRVGVIMAKEVKMKSKNEKIHNNSDGWDAIDSNVIVEFLLGVWLGLP